MRRDAQHRMREDTMYTIIQNYAGATTFALRRELAFKAYAHTAAYDGAISNWLGAILDNAHEKAEGFPRTFTEIGRAHV